MPTCEKSPERMCSSEKFIANRIKIPFKIVIKILQSLIIPKNLIDFKILLNFNIR